MTERYLYNKAKIFLRPYEYLELEQPFFPANIVAEFDEFHLLDKIPVIDSLILEGGDAENAAFDSLYKHTEIKSMEIDYYETEGYSLWTIDLSNFPSLQILVSRSSYNFANISFAKSLKALLVGEWYNPDFSVLEGSGIESLVIINGKKLISFNGFLSDSLKTLFVSYSRVKEISTLSSFNSLEQLEIDHCHCIADWNSFCMPSLKILFLLGNNKLQSVLFVNNLPNLQSFLLEGSIEDGNLVPLKRLNRCFVSPHKKYYNVSKHELKEVYDFKTPLNIEPQFRYRDRNI